MSLTQTERPRHAAPVPSRQAKRRRRRIVLAASLAVLLVAGIAVAAVFYRAALNGSGKINASPNLHLQSATVNGGSTADVCTVSLPAPGSTASVTFQGEPGSTCNLTFGLFRTGVHEMKLQNIKWGSPVTEAFSGAPCGTVVSSSPAGPTMVDVQLTIPLGEVEQPITVDGDAGLFAVKSADWLATACPGGAV